MKFKSGESFGRYRIEMLLGSGGMGAVYRAHDTQLERPVAIKVLSPDSEIARSVGDLLREARSASALNHPNVCTVYEVGEERHCPFIAMEHVEDRTVDAHMRDKPFSLPLALDYIFQIADALGHAHELGVVHGDLKTANILVSPNNRIKIVDFGLARRRTEIQLAATSVTTAVVAGTPYAMAPEQLRGSPPSIQTDVWSLGVFFLEMLAGSPPFAGATTAELATAIMRDPAPSLREHIPA